MFNQLVPSREGGRGLGPKLVQPKLIPKDHGQPARAPLARPAQPHLAQPDRNHVTIESRRHAVLGEKRDLGRASAFVERLDRPAPTRALAVVDLAEIENLPLNNAPVVNPAVLDHRPGPMLLAVLAANLVAQKHARDSRCANLRARALVGTTADSRPLSPIQSVTYRARTPRKSQKSARVGEVGLIAPRWHPGSTPPMMTSASPAPGGQRDRFREIAAATRPRARPRVGFKSTPASIGAPTASPRPTRASASPERRLDAPDLAEREHRRRLSDNRHRREKPQKPRGHHQPKATASAAREGVKRHPVRCDLNQQKPFPRGAIAGTTSHRAWGSQKA